MFNWKSRKERKWLLLLLLLLLSRFSRVRLCATPETAAHQAPPSLGFSRQEYWSGVPLPSPGRGSGAWRKSESESTLGENVLKPLGDQRTDEAPGEVSARTDTNKSTPLHIE